MKVKFSLLTTASFLAVNLMANAASPIADSLTFGDAVSETAHAFKNDGSEIIAGGLGEPARRLLPRGSDDWQGGQMAFTLKVNPDQQNYATVRLWGMDTNNDRLILFCEGKQIGYIHIGDIDLLDFGNDSGEPACFGQFFYNTTPLPLALTKGKTQLSFEIRSIGPVWGYGGNFATFQKPMVEPTRGIYRLYVTTNGYFAPPGDEKQGKLPGDLPVRQKPGPEILTKLKARVNGEIDSLLKSKKPLNEMQVQFLARAYFVKWTVAFQNPQVIPQVLKGLDSLCADYRRNPEMVHNDPVTPNPGWFEFGPAGEAISLLAGPLHPFFDQTISDDGRNISRRAAYAELLQAGRDWHRFHRRLYSNQTMIVDMNIYLSNRGLMALDSTNAFSEPVALRYLYEAVALQPWSDSDPDGAGGQRSWGVGTNYWELTDKGLTRELGYVGYYGEVLDWVTSIYNATRPTPDQPGDEKIKAQLEKFIHARSTFRYPAWDAEGNRAMRIETIIGWRDAHFPGDVLYCERPSWDASALYAAAATLDSRAIGAVQQMFDDNQFFASLDHQMKQNGSLRVTAGLLGVPDQYELLKAQPASVERLPMTKGQPDFIFTDEEDGVVALKNGNDILYVSLYWRAHRGINFLARVHYITPQFQRIATTHEDVLFTPGGLFYVRPDNVGGATPGGVHYPVKFSSAEAGEKLPIARIPDGVKFHAGDESVFAGKGDFYTLRYGDYLIGMNMTADKTFELPLPPDAGSEAFELVSRQNIRLDVPLKVGPHSTVVLWLGKKD